MERERFHRVMDRVFLVLRKASQILLCWAIGWWLIYGLTLLVARTPWTAVAVPVVLFLAWGGKWR